MSWVADVLDRLGVTGRDHGTSFPDGAAFRIEIPSVEGPKVLEAVLRAVLPHPAGTLPRGKARAGPCLIPLACAATPGWAGTMRSRSTTGQPCVRPGCGVLAAAPVARGGR